jgi:hypothetical protein
VTDFVSKTGYLEPEIEEVYKKLGLKILGEVESEKSEAAVKIR